MSRFVFWKPRVEEEVDQELAFHLEMKTREYMSKGLSREAARQEAVRRFGNVRQVSEECRELGARRDRAMAWTEWLHEVGQDAQFALRHLVKNAGFAAIAIVTLAIGIGATTAIFSVVNAVVLRPLPFPAPDRVLLASETWRDMRNSVSVGNYSDWKAQTKSFSRFGAISWSSFNLSEGEAPERALGARATWDYFSVFGVNPEIGRVFSAEEDQPGRSQVVVLSHRLWVRRFGAQPTVLHRSILLNSERYEIIGVMPAAFDLTAGTEEFWVPAAFTPAQLALHDEHFLTVYGRLASGVDRALAQSDLKAIARRLELQYPLDDKERSVVLTPMAEQFVGSAREQLLVLLGAVSFVMLIGCANVANLLLARGAIRAKELAIRASLGAGRGRIVRQLLTETLVLTGLALGLGLVLAYLGIRALIVAAGAAGVPRLEQAGIDLPTLLFALGATLLCTLMAGLLPALRTAAGNLQSTLREGGRGSSSAGQRDLLRRGLVMSEVALALVLLVGAGLLIRTSIHLRKVDPGFDPTGVLTARVTLPKSEYPDVARVTATFERILDALRHAPGVTEAALSSQVPLGREGGSNGLVPEGRPLDPSSVIVSQSRIVTPGYLAAMKIPLIVGRDFTDADRQSGVRVMIVSSTLAQKAWPGENAIGKRVACCEGTPTEPVWKEVIGVAGAVRWGGVDRDAAPEFYLPVQQAPAVAWEWLQRSMTLVARGTKAPALLTPVIRAAVRSINPALPLYDVRGMDERLSLALAQSRLNTVLLSLLGAIGLLLAAVGIYGVIAYFVARRTQEIGVRMALGASTGDVLRLVVGQSLRPVLLGILVGGAGALAVTRLLASQLHGVRPTDPITFGVGALALVGVALLASLLPARRATLVDATMAMRGD